MIIQGLFSSVTLLLVTNPKWYVIVPCTCDMRVFLLLVPWLLSDAGDRIIFWTQLERMLDQERRLH